VTAACYRHSQQHAQMKAGRTETTRQLELHQASNWAQHNAYSPFSNGRNPAVSLILFGQKQNHPCRQSNWLPAHVSITPSIFTPNILLADLALAYGLVLYHVTTTRCFFFVFTNLNIVFKLTATLGSSLSWAKLSYLVLTSMLSLFSHTEHSM